MRDDVLPLATTFDLVRLGAAALMALRRKCAALQNKGIAVVVRLYHWHYSARDAQKAAWDSVWSSPREGWLYCRVDFLENWRLPLGPNQAGSWHWAGSYPSLTVFIMVFWGHRLPVRYVTFISRVLEKTPRYVIACFEHCIRVSPVLRQRLEEGVGYELWVDAGTHFKAYEMLEYQCVHLPEKYGITGGLSFDVEHHGKGPCDGEGGRLKGRCRLQRSVKSFPPRITWSPCSGLPTSGARRETPERQTLRSWYSHHLRSQRFAATQ